MLRPRHLPPSICDVLGKGAESFFTLGRLRNLVPINHRMRIPPSRTKSLFLSHLSSLMPRILEQFTAFVNIACLMSYTFQHIIVLLDEGKQYQ